MRSRPIFYSQLDPRWSHVLYDINPADGDDYLMTSGCGPTTAAMIAATLCDSGITPAEMADFAVAHGDRTPSNGTARTLFAHLAEAYGLRFFQTGSFDRAREALDEGWLAAVHVGKSRWTGGGHYLLWWAAEGDRVYLNDPSGDTVRRSCAPAAELKAAARAYFCFAPPEKEEKVSYEEWKEFYERYMEELRAQPPGEWSEQARLWAQERQILRGDGNGRMNWKLPMTREEYAVTEYRQVTGHEE